MQKVSPMVRAGRRNELGGRMAQDPSRLENECILELKSCNIFYKIDVSRRRKAILSPAALSSLVIRPLQLDEWDTGFDEPAAKPRELALLPGTNSLTQQSSFAEPSTRSRFGSLPRESRGLFAQAPRMLAPDCSSPTAAGLSRGSHAAFCIA